MGTAVLIILHNNRYSMELFANVQLIESDGRVLTGKTAHQVYMNNGVDIFTQCEAHGKN